jgi:hypothetical protein
MTCLLRVLSVNDPAAIRRSTSHLGNRKDAKSRTARLHSRKTSGRIIRHPTTRDIEDGGREVLGTDNATRFFCVPADTASFHDLNIRSNGVPVGCDRDTA